jgi:hypothetical protein
MTWYKRLPEKDYTIKCRVCGVNLDLRKPDDVYRHNHNNILYVRMWAHWFEFDIVSELKCSQKTWLMKKICMN